MKSLSQITITLQRKFFIRSYNNGNIFFYTYLHIFLNNTEYLENYTNKPNINYSNHRRAFFYLTLKTYAIRDLINYNIVIIIK